MEQCKRRRMQASNQNTGDIRSMQGELTAIKKSLGKVDAMQGTMDRLNTQMPEL